MMAVVSDVVYNECTCALDALEKVLVEGRNMMGAFSGRIAVHELFGTEDAAARFTLSFNFGGMTRDFNRVHLG